MQVNNLMQMSMKIRCNRRRHNSMQIAEKFAFPQFRNTSPGSSVRTGLVAHPSHRPKFKLVCINKPRFSIINEEIFYFSFFAAIKIIVHPKCRVLKITNYKLQFSFIPL